MRAKPVGHKSVGDVTASFCVQSLGCTHTDLQGVISPSTGAEQFIRFFLFNYKFGFQLLLTQCNLDKEFCINSQSKALVLSCDINQANHLFPSTDLAHCLVQLELRRWRGNIWSKTSTNKDFHLWTCGRIINGWLQLPSSPDCRKSLTWSAFTDMWQRCELIVASSLHRSPCGFCPLPPGPPTPSNEPTKIPQWNQTMVGSQGWR